MAIVYPFSRPFEVMKPNVINEDSTREKDKLMLIMSSSSYIAEEKIDGCHYNCINGRFFSTHISETTGVPVEKTDNYPHLVEAINSLKYKKILLDGEINYPGKTSQDVTSVTGALPDNAIKFQEQHGWVEYRIFDILRAPNGEWLLNMTWEQRRQILDNLTHELEAVSPYIKVNPYIINGKEQFLDNILKAGKEGIVLKKRSSLYLPGKKPKWDWVKIKQSDEDDVIIMGFAPAKQKYSGTSYETHPYWINGEPVSKFFYMGWIGSIIYGKYNAQTNTLVEIGQCSGMSESQRQQFTDNPDTYIGRVMQIKFMEKTNAGKNRHANFVAIHPDKNPKECII